MKKLLLLSALLLVGCTTTKPQETDYGWKEVKVGEHIEVEYGTYSKIYYGNVDSELKYRVIAHEVLVEVYVVQDYVNTNDINDYYIGTELTVYHYGI